MARRDNIGISQRIRRLRVSESVSFPIRHYASVRTRIYEIKRSNPEREMKTDTTTNRSIIKVTRIK